MGLALRRRQLADSVVGIGRRQVGLRIARRVGAVTETTVHLSKGVARADLVVVCTPVLFIADFVREAAKHCPEGTLITNVGSTKQALAEALDEGLPRGCRFLGSHPIAGSEKTGATSADAELFEGRVAVLTPTRNTRAEDFDFLSEFWQSLGSVVVRMAPEEHDRALAVTSHLPHVVAAALAAAVPEPYYRLAGSGILDATRLAGGDPEMWRQILMQNRENVLAALQLCGTKLSAVHAALRDGNEANLEQFLITAKKSRDALGS